jgi:acid phosphatase type 7
LGQVRYWRQGEDVQVVQSRFEQIPGSLSGLPETIYIHHADLRNLTADTPYRYEIRIDGADPLMGRRNSFRTDGADSFRFIVFGDSGDGGEPQKELAHRMAGEEVAFVAHTGDIAYWSGTFRQFQEAFFQIYPELLSRMPVFPAPGNHDYEFADALAYRSFFHVPTQGVPPAGHGRYYSFDWGPAHFTVIDTNTPFADALAQRDAMLEWLEQDLRRTRQPWRIVMFHHPPFPTSAAKIGDAVSALVREHVTPILERNAVHLVLAGHEHIYQRTQARRGSAFVRDPGGTIYVTTGGGGSQLYSPGQAPFVAASLEGSHYLRVEVSREKIRLEAIDLNGSSPDEFTIPSRPIVFGPALVDSATHGRVPAAGGLATLYGWNLVVGEHVARTSPLQREWEGTRLSLGGGDLGMIYASPTQINVVLPDDQTGQQVLQVRTRSGNVETPVEIRAASPTLFARLVDGTEWAAALHADGTLIDDKRPAAPGEWISVFGTGLGRARGAAAYGQLAPSAPLAIAIGTVTATVNGQEAVVSFAGRAPGFWGLDQINLQVPQRAGAGPLRIFVDGIGSNPVELP